MRLTAALLEELAGAPHTSDLTLTPPRPIPETKPAPQSASLCLTTTPPEELAGALRTLLAPLGLLGVPVADIGLTLLLSLRFMALVFDEARNLALGLAARGVAWAQLTPGGNLQVSPSRHGISLHCA